MLRGFAVFGLTLICLAVFNGVFSFYDQTKIEDTKQLGMDVTQNDIIKTHSMPFFESKVLLVGNILILITGGFFMARQWVKYVSSAAALFCIFGLTGCRRPFEPVKLEVINSYEEAFLIPYKETAEKQQSSHTEDFLKKNLVYSQQVRIPQQWVQLGYEYIGYNGEWRDAGKLIKVDKSPVTREWTADPNTGSSQKNEAIWVMTSDQVEFSTGWTCTARIDSRDDSIKFLANYPNGALESVMDKELRGKLQAAFGLAVTDLPMEELRKNATPFILKTIDEVKSYFKERGISIVNLGITGGFVYKDPKIIETMTKMFNAEQEKEIAKAKTEAILTEAKGRADAILAEKKAEATGIQSIADAKLYEISKAKENPELYVKLKEIEMTMAQIQKWKGEFPYYYTGSQSPQMLLQIPSKDIKTVVPKSE